MRICIHECSRGTAIWKRLSLTACLLHAHVTHVHARCCHGSPTTYVTHTAYPGALLPAGGRLGVYDLKFSAVATPVLPSMRAYCAAATAAAAATSTTAVEIGFCDPLDTNAAGVPVAFLSAAYCSADVRKRTTALPCPAACPALLGDTTNALCH